MSKTKVALTMEDAAKNRSFNDAQLHAAAAAVSLFLLIRQEISQHVDTPEQVNNVAATLAAGVMARGD